MFYQLTDEQGMILDSLKAFLRESGLGARMRDWKVYEAWSDALGAEMSRRALAVRFDKGELLVEVGSAVHLHELRNFTGEQYRRVANQRLGQERIRRVAFKLKR